MTVRTLAKCKGGKHSCLFQYWIFLIVAFSKVKKQKQYKKRAGQNTEPLIALLPLYSQNEISFLMATKTVPKCLELARV